MKEGWTYKKLGEVCEILDSQRKPITKNKRESGSIPYYGATGCLDYVKDYIFDEKLVLLGEDGAKWDAGENSAYIIEGKSWVNNHAHALRPKRDIILDEILVYYLNFANLQPFITGVTVPKLNQEKMRSIDIPIYPISEQQRIVSRLDSAFAHIDERKANAEKQLSEARALFQKSLAKAMEPKEGWEERNLGDVAEVNRGRSKHRPRNDKRLFGGPYPFIQTGDIRNAQGGEIKDFSQTYSEFGLSQSKLWAKGTICITIAANIGETAILGFDACFPDSIVGIHPDETVLDALFLNYYLLSIKKEIDSQSYGTAQKNINLEVLNNIVMQIPPLAEQQRIVERLDALSENIRKYEEIQRQIISECDALKQALLRIVFE